eukprot:TRINITY_DN57998_c0_g1_i1.p1 TRINITY_DN57998_c0_g1~~TRINITY_DN57998_c0_g1_i1.p1  ORF type:complete len:100 (-),score=3.69 TRINITY_DN57998_c0_g1_i1:80-379(-)
MELPMPTITKNGSHRSFHFIIRKTRIIMKSSQQFFSLCILLISFFVNISIFFVYIVLLFKEFEIFFCHLLHKWLNIPHKYGSNVPNAAQSSINQNCLLS